MRAITSGETPMVAALACSLWDRPVATTKSFLDCDRVGVNASPLQADQFTDPKAGPHGDV